MLKAYYKTWGFDDNASGVNFEELPTRNCTEKELHINGQSDSESNFFKSHRNSQGDVAFYFRKLKCLDVDKVEIQGDYNSPRTRSLAIIFEKCDNSTFTGTCQSEETINAWLARKFILINMNQMSFANRDYDENTKV